MNLIFQCWNGAVQPGARASVESMRAYAERVGADYRFYENRPLGICDNGRHFDRLRPLFDAELRKFYRVLYVDCDVFAVDGLTDSIFDASVGDFGMCEEPQQPAYREGRKREINGWNDERWARAVRDRWGILVPRDEHGRVRVFNSGVLLFSRTARDAVWLSPQEYIDAIRVAGLPSFYAIDQNYMHAMAFDPRMSFTLLDQEWNRQIHGLDGGGVYDGRTDRTRFVHVQLRCADHWDAATLRRVVDLPQSEWRVPA